MKKSNQSLNYHDYLKLDSLLNSQEMLSNKMGTRAHDEMLFIVTHQVYELWFKQILFEINSVLHVFNKKSIKESHIGLAVNRLERVNEIQQLLIDQIKILETMTPMDFLDFRHLLNPASGFQSAQFRLIENKIGLLSDNRHKYSGKDYKTKVNKDQLEQIKNSESEKSLFDLTEQWLERTPFLISDEFDFWSQYRLAVKEMIENDKNLIERNNELSYSEKENYYEQCKITEKMFKSLFDEAVFIKRLKNGKGRLSYKATHAALLIFLYRDQPMLYNPFKLLSRLIDLDELLNTWRYKHHLMVMRMIGRKIGTGGSSGANYLKQTVKKHRVFEDLTNLTTFLIPRSALPKLPKKILHNLNFHYDKKLDDGF